MFFLLNSRFFGDPYSLSIMSSIVGPSLGSVLPMTIYPMEAAMTSRYTAPVESSQTIRLAFRLETLEVIFPTVATSVEVFLSGCVGSDVSILTAVSMRLWVGVVDCLTASTLVSGTAGREGVPSEWLDDWLEANREGLPCNIGILFCWGIPMVVGVFCHPSVGESNTWPNIVVGGGRRLSTSFSISSPSIISHLVMVMNSPTAWHSSLTLSAKGWNSWLTGRETFSAQCCRHRQ